MKDEVEDKADTNPVPRQRRWSNRVKAIKAKGVFYEISLEAALKWLDLIRVFGFVQDVLNVLSRSADGQKGLALSAVSV